MDTGQNSAIEAATGAGRSAADAYGAGLQFAAALRAQAEKKQEAGLKQQEKQAADQKADTAARSANDLEHRRAGDVPYTAPLGDAARPEMTFDPDGGGKSHVVPHPPPPDPNRLHRDAYGQTWLLKDPDAKDAKANATETAGVLEKGATPVTPASKGSTPYLSGSASDGYPVPADPGRVVTPAGGKQGYYVPTKDQAAARTMREHIATVHAEEDAKGVALPDALADAYEKTHHLPAGSMKGFKVPPSVAGQLLEHMTPTEHKENHDDWVRIASDPKSSADEKQRATAALKLDDKYYQDRKAPKEAKDPNQPKPATPSQSNAIERRKKAALIRAEATFKKERGSMDPDVSGGAEDRLKAAKEEAQNTYESEIERYGGSTEGGGAGAPAKTAAPAAAPGKTAPPAAPAAASAPRTATLAQVRAYAKKFKLSEAAAIKEFKANKYAIGQ